MAKAGGGAHAPQRFGAHSFPARPAAVGVRPPCFTWPPVESIATRIVIHVLLIVCRDRLGARDSTTSRLAGERSDQRLSSEGAPSAVGRATLVGSLSNCPRTHIERHAVKDEPDLRIQASDNQTLEGTPQPDLDLILQNWICIAALAWSGSILHGPGAIVLTIDSDGTQPSYRPGSPARAVRSPLTPTTRGSRS